MDDADDSMTKEHMREVNQAFYRAEPAEYFHMRLTTLGTAIGSPDGLHSLLAPPGVTAYGVTINDDGERPTDASLARYALIESTNIAHHSIETFFRLLLAHASGNECPALAVAWARSPGELKETLESMVLSPDFEDALVVELGQIVFGLDHKVPGQRDRIVACLPLCRDLARMYLDEASVYNSIKHGMAAIAGDAYLAVGDAGTSGSGFAVSGTSIEFLERVPAGQSRHSGDRQLGGWTSASVWPLRSLRCTSSTECGPWPASATRVTQSTNGSLCTSQKDAACATPATRTRRACRPRSIGSRNELEHASVGRSADHNGLAQCSH